MKYKVLGPRVLLKVKKMDDKFENSMIARPDQMIDQDTAFQTVGVVADIGPTVTKEYEGFNDLRKGDLVHFQRYGAQRLGSKKEDEHEFWIINGKDILCIEHKEELKVNTN